MTSRGPAPDEIRDQSVQEAFRYAYDHPNENVVYVNELPVGQAMTIDVLRLFGWTIARTQSLPAIIRWLTGLQTVKDLAIALINGDDNPILSYWLERRSATRGRSPPTVSELTLRIHLIEILRVIAKHPKPGAPRKRIGAKRARDMLVARLRPVRQLTPKMLEHWQHNIDREIALADPDTRKQFDLQRNGLRLELQAMTLEQLLDRASWQAHLTGPATGGGAELPGKPPL